jgi:hypothetical protein
VTENNVISGEDQDLHGIKGSAVGRESVASGEDN